MHKKGNIVNNKKMLVIANNIRTFGYITSVKEQTKENKEFFDVMNKVFTDPEIPDSIKQIRFLKEQIIKAFPKGFYMIVCGLPIVLDNSKFIDVQSVHILEPSVETFVNEDINNTNKRSDVIIKPKYGIREFDIIATNQITKTPKHVYLHFDEKPDNDDL